MTSCILYNIYHLTQFVSGQSQMLLEKCNRLLERPLLPSLHLRVTQITSNSKTMRASIPILPHITRSEFPPTEDLIGYCLRLGREL